MIGSPKPACEEAPDRGADLHHARFKLRVQAGTDDRRIVLDDCAPVQHTRVLALDIIDDDMDLTFAC